MFKWFMMRIKKEGKERIQGKNQSHDFNNVLTDSLAFNLKTINDCIGHSPDVVIRQFRIGNREQKAAVVYVDGLADKSAVNEHIMKPLMLEVAKIDRTEQFPASRTPINIIKDAIITNCQAREALDLDDCILEVLSGNTALLVDGCNKVLILGTPGWEARSIEEPVTESVVRGPRDGFVETLRNNIVLLRRRIRDPNFTMIKYKVGRRSKKDLVVTYIKGLTNQGLVDEVKRRIERIDIDDVQESGYVEQLIQDSFLSPFPQVQNTERPDKVVSALMEGRVAILLDGTPFALIVPVTFPILMQAPEDYYERWAFASVVRLLRYVLIFISLFLPSIYIALVSYNQGLIPTKLAISIAASREGVPFPSFIEAFIMELTIEILREAGIRLPRPVGQAVGIVGGLVIGEAAVQARIVSPIMVIVVALTAISSFATPQYSFGIAFRYLRFVIMSLAAVLGLYGVVLAYIMITVHFVKLKSFGVNYAAPYVPYKPGDWKDFLIRMPVKAMKHRPELAKPQDTRRLGKRHIKERQGG
jgi:spore germination protein